MNKKLLIATICLASAGLQFVRADSTTVTFDSGDFMIFDNPALHSGSDVALTGGNSMIDGDGAVLQLGYFTGATSGSNAFTGTWVPLSGQTSLNTALVPGADPATETYAQTSIGDRHNFFAGDGTFALSLTFTVGDAMSGNSLPPAGTILAIRFYNGTSLLTSSYYNTVSNGATSNNTWAWAAPTSSNPLVNVSLSLNDPSLVWESVVLDSQSANTAFHTTIAIPEPSTLALVCLGLVGVPLGYRRFRRARISAS
jgi:PEP-CTERM motif